MAQRLRKVSGVREKKHARAADWPGGAACRNFKISTPPRPGKYLPALCGFSRRPMSSRAAIIRKVTGSQSVAEQVVELLAEHKRRGTGFETAWYQSVTSVLAGVTRDSLGTSWLDVLEWSRDAWKRAYEDKPRLTIDWLEPIAGDWTDTPPRGWRTELLA
jgi:hypothetical protein